MNYKVIQGNNIDTLKTYPDNYFDSIVTDPPYGIDFLGKAWDANTGALETYQECLRVLKPGGHILAFSAARTYHHLAITLEQAGFEIRDQIMWIYSSGFPKSQDVGRSIQRSIGVEEYEDMVDTTKNAGFGMTDHARVRAGEEWSTPAKQVGKAKVTDPIAQQWEGWGTALKPAHEPIALARKPLKQSIAKNVQQWNVGALNIDATRIEWEPGELEKEQAWREKYSSKNTGGPTFSENDIDLQRKSITDTSVKDAPLQGRFPSNVIGEILQGNYQKYFYCPKVSRRERHTGFELPEPMFGNVQGAYDENGERFAVGLDARGIATEATMLDDMGGYYCDSQGNAQDEPGMIVKLPHMSGTVSANGLKEEYRKWAQTNGKIINVGNNHPTVKPIELMKYLIKLVTPQGGKVLDPFCGSGSTGCAAIELGYEFVGCELDPAYVNIALTRISAWNTQHNPLPEEFFNE